MDGVGMIGEHTLDGGDYRTSQQKIDDIHKQIDGLNDQIQDLSYISTDPNLGEASTQAKKEIAEIEDGQQQLIDEINQIKRNYAGKFDTWASNELSPTVSKPLQKWGLIDQYSPSRLEKPVFETYEERAEKERIAAEKTREELITTNSHDDINPSDNAWYRWQYRTSASNDDPLTVKLYGTRNERSGNSLNIKSKGSIMHFLDQSPLSGFMHNKTKVFYKNSKANDYFGYLKANEDGTHQVMYKKKKDIPADELYKNTFLVRQNDFDAINFNGRHIDRNFNGHTYWSLKGTNYKDPIDGKWKERPAIPISAGRDHNTYDYSSGQTVVYIFPYKDKTRYVHFAGSPNAIKKEGDRIKKEYALKKNDLKIGVSDAGSYSSSVKGNITNDLLNSKDYGYYNMRGDTGAGMALIEKKVGGELKKLKRGGELRKLKRGGQLPKAQIGGTEWNEYTMSLNSPEAWSDKIRHTEQNDSDNTQQVLKEYAMWRKSNDWVHDNKKPKDPFNINEYQAIPRPEQLQTPSMEDQVYSRFPALRNMGEVTFKADPEFTREATGIGDIEYFGPGEDKTQITYPNSFVYPHPKVGTHGIVYNPETNNAQSIALDMLHGLSKDDKNYEKFRNNFGESYMNSIFREDFERDVKMFKEEIGEDKFNEWYDDDKDYFKQSYLDGVIRNLLFEGSPEDFKESRYWEGAREGYLSQPGLKETFNALEGYLKTPTKKHGGQLPMHFKKNNSRKQNKTHLIKMLGLREFTGR
jgi:hypothetical protein